MDILTPQEVKEWLRIDYDDPMIDVLIQNAYDVAEGAIDGFVEKSKSARFRRKLKLFLLNYIVNAYEDRGISPEPNSKMNFVNASLLMQLQYGTYSEDDE